MTTIRDLVALGFDLDTEIVEYVHDDDNYACTVDMEVRHVDDGSNRTVITLIRRSEFVVLADRDDDEAEWGVNYAIDRQEMEQEGTR